MCGLYNMFYHYTKKYWKAYMNLIASSERIKPVILAVDDCIFSCWWFTCRSGSGLPGVPWGAVPATIPQYVGGSVLRHAFYGRVR